MISEEFEQDCSINFKMHPARQLWWVLLFMRLEQKYGAHFIPRFFAVFKKIALAGTCCELPSPAFPRGGVWIDHLNGIVVNRNARIGEGVRIYHQVTIGADFDHGPGEAPVIGDRTRIGAGAKIIGNIRVGSNVTIGANAVVTKDVPDNATVVGANVIID